MSVNFNGLKPTPGEALSILWSDEAPNLGLEEGEPGICVGLAVYCGFQALNRAFQDWPLKDYRLQAPALGARFCHFDREAEEFEQWIAIGKRLQWLFKKNGSRIESIIAVKRYFSDPSLKNGGYIFERKNLPNALSHYCGEPQQSRFFCLIIGGKKKTPSHAIELGIDAPNIHFIDPRFGPVLANSLDDLLCRLRDLFNTRYPDFPLATLFECTLTET